MKFKDHSVKEVKQFQTEIEMVYFKLLKMQNKDYVVKIERVNNGCIEITIKKSVREIKLEVNLTAEYYDESQGNNYDTLLEEIKSFEIDCDNLKIYKDTKSGKLKVIKNGADQDI